MWKRLKEVSLLQLPVLMLLLLLRPATLSCCSPLQILSSCSIAQLRLPALLAGSCSLLHPPYPPPSSFIQLRFPAPASRLFLPSPRSSLLPSLLFPLTYFSQLFYYCPLSPSLPITCLSISPAPSPFTLTQLLLLPSPAACSLLLLPLLNPPVMPASVTLTRFT